MAQASPAKNRATVKPRPSTPAPNGEAVAVKPARAEQPLSFQIGPVKRVSTGVRLLNMMLYGPYGHGKTTFAGSALDVPAMQDVLFIAAEPGEMSLTSRGTLDVIHINRYKQIARIYEYLVAHCQWRDEGDDAKLLEYEMKLKSEVVPVEEQEVEPKEEGRTWFVEQRLRTGRPMDEPYRYRTVIIDSISEVHKYLVYMHTGVDIGRTKLDAEIEKMEEWQIAQEQFRLFVRSFRDLPMNVIFVSAEQMEPAERNRKKNPLAGQSLPKLAGQSAADIAGFVDIVGYLIREVGKDGDYVRRMYLGAGYEGFISKHRFENLPDLDYIEIPPHTSGMLQLLELSRKDAELDGNPQPATAAARSHTVSAGTRAAAPQHSSPARSPLAARGGTSGGARRGR